MGTSFFSSLEPLHQNLLAATATVVYVKTVVGGCDWAVSQELIPSKVSRKMIHVAAGSWILFWPLFTTDHWTWQLNILVPAIYTVQLFVKGAILRNPEDTDIQTMTRTGNPTELLFGPIYFTILMCICGTYLFRQELAILILACLGFGDGIAPLVGTYFPMGRYPTFPFGPKDTKTLSGSLGFVVASFVGYAIFSSAGIVVALDSSSSSISVTAVDWPRILRVVAMATVTEGITGQFDNVCIPLLIYGLCTYTNYAL